MAVPVVVVVSSAGIIAMIPLIAKSVSLLLKTRVLFVPKKRPILTPDKKLIKKWRRAEVRADAKWKGSVGRIAATHRMPRNAWLLPRHMAVFRRSRRALCLNNLPNRDLMPEGPESLDLRKISGGLKRRGTEDLKSFDNLKVNSGDKILRGLVLREDLPDQVTCLPVSQDFLADQAVLKVKVDSRVDQAVLPGAKEVALVMAT